MVIGEEILFFKDEQENVKRRDNRAQQLQEMFGKHRTLNLHVATVDELDYPLLCIYQDKSGSKTTAISTSELWKTWLKKAGAKMDYGFL